MKFLRTITNSLVSKDFYAEILASDQPKQVRKGMWYLFRLYVVAALFLTVLLSINISSMIPRFDAIARNILPPGAEVIIRNGALTTNTNPIEIAFPENAKEQAVAIDPDAALSVEKAKNLLVLDITASSTVEALVSRSTVILVTSDGFVFQGDNARYTIGRFANIKDLDVTIDEAWLVSKVEWMKGFLKFFPFVAFFIILGGMYASSLLACVFYALLIMLMMRINKTSHSFATAYVVALYSRTLALAIGLVAYVVPLFGLGTVSIAIQLIFMAWMLRTRKSIIDSEDDEHEVA